MEHFRWQLKTSGSGRILSVIPAWCVYESTGFHLGNIGYISRRATAGPRALGLKGVAAVKRILLGALAVVALAAAACGEEGQITPVAPTATPTSDAPTLTPGARTEDPTATPLPSTAIQLSSKPRSTSPDVSTSDATDLVAGNSAFAFELYQALREEPGNLFFSPYSISLALAMTYAGARGETELQMADTLEFALSQDSLHPAFNQLDLELASRGEGAAGKDEKGFRLNIVNAIWGQEGYEFLDEFLDTLAESYGAGLRLLDYINEPEESRVIINDWVEDQTEGRIEDLIPKGVIDPLTRLVLANAIYFNAAWLDPFPEGTVDAPFNLLDGGEVLVPMMSQQTSAFGYAEGDGYQAVELPYDGREMSMVILLPDSGRFDEFEAALDAGVVNAIAEALAYRFDVALTMPRFEFESKFRLSEALSDMGMPIAFVEAEADFSGMNGEGRLFIQDVVHKAFVAVDEAGTEAAAATAVIVSIVSERQRVEVNVDRPFVFLIRDIETGTILFVGRVLSPSA